MSDWGDGKALETLLELMVITSTLPVLETDEDLEMEGDGDLDLFTGLELSDLDLDLLDQEADLETGDLELDIEWDGDLDIVRDLVLDLDTEACRLSVLFLSASPG